MSGAQAAHKGKGFYNPSPKKKKTAPLTKPKGIVICAHAAFISEEEEEVPALRADDITPLPPSVPVEGLSKEEQLSFALKASMGTTLEERTTRVASFITT